MKITIDQMMKLSKKLDDYPEGRFKGILKSAKFVWDPKVGDMVYQIDFYSNTVESQFESIIENL